MNTTTRQTFNFSTWALPSLFVIGIVFALAGVVAPALAAKPDCTIDPSHPSCTTMVEAVARSPAIQTS